jgi:hypothetical protein
MRCTQHWSVYDARTSLHGCAGLLLHLRSRQGQHRLLAHSATAHTRRAVALIDATDISLDCYKTRRSCATHLSSVHLHIHSLYMQP